MKAKTKLFELIDKSITRPETNAFPERYKIHQYWSRKPWYVVRRYIKQFTIEGEVVLDPFSGSGVTACESLITKRKFIGVDINPIAVLLTKLTCVSPISLEIITSYYNTVYDNVSETIKQLYSTQCRKCNETTQIINTIWHNERPLKIFYECDRCGNHELTDINSKDLKNIENINNTEIKNWYPKNVLLPKDSDVKYLHKLFTKRNLLALSLLFDEINKLPESIEKELLLLMFLSTIVRCSKLIFINKYRLAKGVNPAGVWGEKRYWIPDQYIENNVYYYFKVRLSKILKAKKETNNLISDFFSDETFAIKNTSATDLSFLKDNSVDYCFTDPPYGGSIRYLDLSLIWNSWLGNKEIENEIVVNEDKPLQTYQMLMLKAFSEIFRVLKNGKYMSVTFHNSDIKVWDVLITVCKEAGFELLNVLSQEPIKTSHNQIDMKGNVRTDIVLTFRKPANGKQSVKYDEVKIDKTELIRSIVSNFSKKKQNFTTREIYDEALLIWIAKSYNCKIMEPFVSLKSFDEILEKLNLTKVNEFESDYKGEKREVIKWSYQ